MPIFDQGYRHWDGELSGLAWRWWAITRNGVAAQWKSKAVKAVVFMALGPALLLAGFLIVWGLFEQRSSLLLPFLSIIKLAGLMSRCTTLFSCA